MRKRERRRRRSAMQRMELHHSNEHVENETG
jgi:hypothetical protein